MSTDKTMATRRSAPNSSEEFEPLKAAPRTSVPVGHWKDGTWDMFKYGYLHCSVLNACCCVPIAAGQVATRLQLNTYGLPGTPAEAAVAFSKLLTLVASFWVTRAVLLIIIAILDPNLESKEWIDPPASYYFLCFVDDMLALVYFVFTVVLVRNLRTQVRMKYAIPESDQCPGGCEDTCCSLFCSCCVVAQLMRHTADYDTYGGRCCTSTGLPFHAPTIV